MDHATTTPTQEMNVGQRSFPSILGCVPGVAVCVWACVADRFRQPDGTLDAMICLPIAVGMGLILLGVTWMGRWRGLGPAALWLTLALVGQAVSLQLIDAGNGVHYQHYRAMSALLSGTDRYLLAYLLIQAVIVIVGLGRIVPVLRRGLARLGRPWQVAGVGFVLFIASATKINQPVPAYVAELVFATLVQLVHLACIVLAVVAVPRDAWAAGSARWRGMIERETAPLDRFALLAAGGVTVLASLLNVLVYERHPHIPDEVAYLLQARYFAAGRLSLPEPPVPEAFDLYLMERDRRAWYSCFPPGWPAMLAVGVRLKVEWLVNPVLAGLVVLGAYALLRELYDRHTARLATLLLCVSPWFVFMAMSFMAHIFSLACAVAAALGVVRARRTGHAGWGWIAGVALGSVSLTRPLEGVAMAVLVGLWAIGLGGTRLKPTSLIGLVVGAVVVGGLALPYNQHLTGDATAFPVMRYFDNHFGPGKNALGFGSDRGLGWKGVDPFPGHGLLDVLMNGNLNVHAINVELLGWSTGSLLLMALLIFSNAMRPSDYPMLAVILVVAGLHSFYWFSGGPDFGARYWFLVIVPCVTLSARGAVVLAERLRNGAATHEQSSHEGRVFVGVLALCVMAIVNFFPWRAIDKYHGYRGLRPYIRELAAQHEFGRSLVLIRSPGSDVYGAYDYASAAVYNPLDLHADAPIYAWERNPSVRDRLLDTYRDRPVWILNGPTPDHAGFEVVAGPLSSTDLTH